MKKIILIVLVIIGVNMDGFAQVNPHAIGVRSGSGNFGLGNEVSYQHGFGESNRLELDLGFRNSNAFSHSHIYLTGSYHWVFNIVSGFNWFLGPAAQVGMYNHKNNSSEDGITLGVGAQGGVEFDFNEFDVPLMVSVDGRPIFGLLGGTSGFGYGGSAAIRYTF